MVTWLDIANAYGSMPHSLILTALERTHVPESMRQLVKSYYSDIKIRFTTKEYTTDWQQVEKGIITGCTISVILFAITMTMLVMSVKGETKGPKTTTGQQQQNSRLFMDDITTTTGNLVQTKYRFRLLLYPDRIFAYRKTVSKGAAFQKNIPPPLFVSRECD